MDEPRHEPPTPSRTQRRRESRRRGALAALLVAGGIVLLVGVTLIGWRLVATSGSPQPTAAVAPDSAAPANVDVETTPSPTSTASAPTSPTIIEIGWVGDLTPGSKYGQPPRNGRALFDETATLTRKPDIMIANLEGTFGNGGPSKCDGRDSSACYAFQAPPANAGALSWAGFDAVSIANNHSRDYLDAGLASTRKALKNSDVAYTGLPEQVTVLDADGVSVALLGFSPYPWNQSIADIDAAKALVKKASKQADVVVVLMHAGAEGADKTRTPKGAEKAYGEFRGDSRAFSHAVVDAGADLVFGSGPHVVRGVERYKDKVIAYSLGNFAGWKNFNTSGTLGLSGLITVKIDADGDVQSGRWVSLRIDEPGVPSPDKSHESAQLVDELSRKDFGDRAADFDDIGNF